MADKKKKKPRPGEDPKKTLSQRLIEALREGKGGIPKITRERREILEEAAEDPTIPISSLKKKKKKTRASRIINRA